MRGPSSQRGLTWQSDTPVEEWVREAKFFDICDGMKYFHRVKGYYVFYIEASHLEMCRNGGDYMKKIWGLISTLGMAFFDACRVWSG